MASIPTTAFVLAAGLGTRMRPFTDRLPKPLVPLAGRTLIDHVLDRIADVGINEAVVNVHYMADLIEAHVRSRAGQGRAPRIRISDERLELLDTGGGVAKALPMLGDGPFLVHNSDTIWLECREPNLARLCAAFDSTRMDALLLLAVRETSLGYSGQGDFSLAADGRLVRATKGEMVPYVFAGASMAVPRLMRDCPHGPFSLNRVWDRALAEGRLFGLLLDGVWMHVGDPAALREAERRIGYAGTS